ncbi:MAG TPA: hypothetical protein VGH66_07800 [Acidimicrobiales bacterium]|jgi:hypothetical protein
MTISRDRARTTLAAIRLVNGVAALFAPRLVARILGVDPAKSPAVLYVLRMFGVRTAVIGLELLVSEGEHLEDALRVGIAIHASDTIAAIIAGFRHQLPARHAATTTLISSINTGLAIVAATAEK